MVERLLVIGGFTAYSLLLGLWGVERDRPAWRVLAAFESMDLLLSEGFGADWTPAINLIEEIAVLWALYFFAWGRIAIWMMAVIGLFCIAHLCLYLDVEIGTNLIHDHYPLTIRGLIVILAALGTNGVINVAKGIRDSLLTGSLCRLRGYQLDILGVTRKKKDREDKKTII